MAIVPVAAIMARLVSEPARYDVSSVDGTCPSDGCSYMLVGRRLEHIQLRIAVLPRSTADVSSSQTLYAFNDLFIGPRSHVSARYRFEYAGRAGNRSSSGLIVSTGAGSTGWLQTVVNGSVGIAAGITEVDDGGQQTGQDAPRPARRSDPAR